MRWKWCLVALCLAAGFLGNSRVDPVQAQAGAIEVTKQSGEPLNSGSSLAREAVALHHAGFPATLKETPGVEPASTGGGIQYVFRYTLGVKEPLRAVETRVLLFDVWGDYVATLSTSELRDFPVGESDSLVAKWRGLSASEAAEHYASIAYVARVRTASGKVLEADPAPVLLEARKLGRYIVPADLQPSAAIKRQRAFD